MSQEILNSTTRSLKIRVTVKVIRLQGAHLLVVYRKSQMKQPDNASYFLDSQMSSINEVDCVWNVTAHAQKPDIVFRRKGRVHLNRRGRQFSRLLAAEVCASSLDTPRPEVVWELWLPAPFASFPFISPPVRHRVPSHFNWTLRSHPIFSLKLN